MRLLRADIKNFRSIADQTIEFEPTCRVLVGVNESGKTNVLRALQLLDEDIEPDLDDIRDLRPDEDTQETGQVRFAFAPTPEERTAAYKTLMRETAGNSESPILERSGKQLTLKQLFASWGEVLYRVPLQEGAEKFYSYWRQPESKVIAGWCKPTKGVAGTITVDGVAKNISSFALIAPALSRTMSPSLVTPITANEVYSLIANAIPDQAGLPSVVYWAYDEANLLPGSIPVQAFAENPDMCMPLKHMFALAGRPKAAEAITEAEGKKNGMVNLLNRVAEITTRHIISVWKEFKGLRIELSHNGQNIDAVIKDKFNRFDLARRSDGFKRFISFLLLVSVKAKARQLTNTLYLHDEPDTSLHPSGARYLREELINLSDGNYVVYSTHSIFMIDRENLGRHLIVRKENETTTLEEVTASNIVDEEVIYNALGYSIFEQLKAKNIVFEGWRDKRLYQVRLSKLPTNVSNRAELKEVGVCHVKGVSDIGRVTPMLELARRSWMIVSDADSAARDQERKYRGEGPWFRYDELGAGAGFVTSEDFIAWSAFQEPLEKVVAENPAMTLVGDWSALNGDGKIEKIRQWLQAGGFTADQVKVTMEQIKEAVFKALKPAQILDDYLPVLGNIGAKLNALKKPAVPS